MIASCGNLENENAISSLLQAAQNNRIRRWSFSGPSGDPSARFAPRFAERKRRVPIPQPCLKRHPPDRPDPNVVLQHKRHGCSRLGRCRASDCSAQLICRIKSPSRDGEVDGPWSEYGVLLGVRAYFEG